MASFPKNIASRRQLEKLFCPLPGILKSNLMHSTAYLSIKLKLGIDKPAFIDDC